MCLQGKSFCTPPNTNAIDFETFWNELVYRTRPFVQWYTD